MQIETKFFGNLVVDEKEFILFNHGIPGFENYHRFMISQYTDESPFAIMQSVEKADLAFILIGLEKVVPGYSIELTDDVVAELKLTQPEEAVMYAIVTITGDLVNATVNLAAPLCISNQAKLGKQIILNNPDYGLKHSLFATAPEKIVVK
jgi:flagellar assembly factor FliW